MGINNSITPHISKILGPSLTGDQRITLLFQKINTLSKDELPIFILEILQHEDESDIDILKISIYKHLELSEEGVFFTEMFITGLIRAIEQETDENVKRWGFLSLKWRYAHLPIIRELCKRAIDNPDEDETVKINAEYVLE